MGIPTKNSSARIFANHELVTLVVYRLGGETKPIDTEDVAVEANMIAPGRFTWRKYSDQINIELVRAFLSDAKKPKNGQYLTGSGNNGWMLTERGLDFSRRNKNKIQFAGKKGPKLSVQQKRWLKRERARIVQSNAYEKYKEGVIDKVSPQEAESLFRIDDYIESAARARVILRFKNAFSGDQELGPLIEILVSKVRGVHK